MDIRVDGRVDIRLEKKGLGVDLVGGSRVLFRAVSRSVARLAYRRHPSKGLGMRVGLRLGMAAGIRGTRRAPDQQSDCGAAPSNRSD